MPVARPYTLIADRGTSILHPPPKGKAWVARPQVRRSIQMRGLGCPRLRSRWGIGIRPCLDRANELADCEPGSADESVPFATVR
jgi:hypothetical protein